MTEELPEAVEKIIGPSSSLQYGDTLMTLLATLWWRPVTAFEALRDHPGAVNRPPGALFISTTHASVAASCDTISRWLRKVVSHSITSSSSSRQPTIRSVASDLALLRGVPLDDVITHGNWASSMMFDNHYRRSRHISSDITSSVLPCSSSSPSA
ncbi:hypothetical protein O0I10_007519 [Lichtheimia ornata]|uniref:Uncharacterized protein n=1 Tax=Lichtheimia ornata TaxID=688661 RepID=A0AAD7UZS7_9FUNG|nr:uncharacterized protein O0I10_007519 [Lichtheimia ornata]KAJ8656673.1 hypothetical protein O0I10_007519 [Lichtheimia ornata]